MEIKYESNLRWLLYTVKGGKFPYHLLIENTPGEFLSLFVQDRWPGPNKKIFCKFNGVLKEKELPKDEPIERCSIVSRSKYGKKLTVILDRPIKKRCWFIFLKKEYKKRPGEFYDQVFWITQSSAVADRRGAYLYKSPKRGGFHVIIDINERYPYKFPYAKVEKRKLPVGDYGLIYNQNIIAIAERKTHDNFIHEISTFEVLKAKLQELDNFPYKALVFECPYKNFLSSKKVAPYSAPYVAQLIAELIAEFPRIQFVFGSSRKGANEWIYRWFERIFRKIKINNLKP